MTRGPLLDEFTPNYLVRVGHLLPHQGDHEPWRNTQDYFIDRKTFRDEALEDGVLQFTSPA